MNGSESLVRNTLEALKQDYHIHEPEFRYWALVDLSEEERGEPDDDFYVTRFAAENVK